MESIWLCILFIATLLAEKTPFHAQFVTGTNAIALYSMVSFSLSAVMSVPQVVKGLNGDTKRIRGSIAAGTGIIISYHRSKKREQAKKEFAAEACDMNIMHFYGLLKRKNRTFRVDIRIDIPLK